MKRNGISFRRSRNIVTMPTKDENGNLMPYYADGKTNYLQFGKVVPQGKEIPAGAVKTNWRFGDTKEPIHAVLIPMNGHSLTNLGYGIDGRAYMMHDGVCYVGTRHSK